MTKNVLEDPSKKWLKWAESLQSIAQTGLHYCKDVYDKERYQHIQHIAADILGQYSTLPSDSILEIFKLGSGYQTPKIDVRGAIFQENKVLLVRESSEQRWSLPGGWADIQYTPTENIIREIQEESGFDARVLKLAAVLDKAKHAHPDDLPYTYKLFFLCEINGGKPQTSIETDAIDWFSLDTLPILSLARVTAEQIHLLYKHHLDMTRQTDYD